MTSMLVRAVDLVRKGIWLIVPLLVLSVASACSGRSATTATIATIETTGPGLAGAEFIVHQAPG